MTEPEFKDYDRLSGEASELFNMQAGLVARRKVDRPIAETRNPQCIKLARIGAERWRELYSL